MERFTFFKQTTQIVTQLGARILASTHIRPRLPGFVQRIPWLADLPNKHPRIIRVGAYWLAMALALSS